MSHAFNDKDKILPILAQDILLDKVCNHPIDKPFAIREVLYNTKTKLGLSTLKEEEFQHYLFNTSTVLATVTILSIFIKENKDKIESLFNKYNHDGFSTFNDKKLKLVNGKNKKYNYLLSVIRTSFAHYNYEVYPDNTIRITTKKFDKKEITIDPNKSFKTIYEEIKIQHDGYLIEELNDNKLTLTNFNKHTDKNEIDWLIKIKDLNLLAGELIDLVYNYFALQDKENS